MCFLPLASAASHLRAVHLWGCAAHNRSCSSLSGLMSYLCCSSISGSVSNRGTYSPGSLVTEVVRRLTSADCSSLPILHLIFNLPGAALKDIIKTKAGERTGGGGGRRRVSRVETAKLESWHLSSSLFFLSFLLSGGLLLGGCRVLLSL